MAQANVLFRRSIGLRSICLLLTRITDMRRFGLLITVLFWLTTSVTLAQSSVPVVTSSSMPRSTPEKQGVSSAELLTFLDDVDSNVDTMNSFMLLRRGHVVAEAWWTPYDAQTPHVLYSLSKSFTSTAVGLAIAEGKLTLDDEVLKYFPEDAPAEPSAHLKAMRVRDLLRMTTGHATEPPMWRDQPDSSTTGAAWTKKFLHHPVDFKPGTLFVYNTPATYMQSAIVQKVTGQTVRDYLVPRLFEPLGIETPNWVTSPEGISAGGYGLLAKTEDLAKFGQLYLQKGQWNGTQLIPGDWIAEATARQASNGSDPNSDWSQGYGYQFWRSRHESFRGDGAFGQYLLVLPNEDAVIVITSGVKNMQDVLNRVWEKLLPALKPSALPDNADAQQALNSRMASLTVKRPTGQPTSSISEKVSGEWFEFPENELDLRAISLRFSGNDSVIIVRTAHGELTTPFGFDDWKKSNNAFAVGMNKFVSVPEKALIAASGAWKDNHVLTLKFVAYETPFYTTLNLRFENNQLFLDAEHNAAFGPTKLPQMVGKQGVR